MGLMGYVSEKIFQREMETAKTVETSSEFNALNFIAITGGVAVILFGLGYALHGLGQSLVPTAQIIDELHDSDSSDTDGGNSDTETD